MRLGRRQTKAINIAFIDAFYDEICVRDGVKDAFIQINMHFGFIIGNIRLQRHTRLVRFRLGPSRGVSGESQSLVLLPIGDEDFADAFVLVADPQLAQFVPLEDDLVGPAARAVAEHAVTAPAVDFGARRRGLRRRGRMA